MNALVTHQRPNCRRFVPAAALGLLLCGLGAGAAACVSRPVTHSVTMDGTTYQPSEITVNAGDTVVWINKDFFPHTATWQGIFDSGTVNPGQTWQYVPTKPGKIDYVCTLHPTMKGTVIVK